MSRIVMGKLAMDTDLLEGILELVKREKIRRGIFLSQGDLSWFPRNASPIFTNFLLDICLGNNIP